MISYAILCMTFLFKYQDGKVCELDIGRKVRYTYQGDYLSKQKRTFLMICFAVFFLIHKRMFVIMLLGATITVGG